MEQVSITLYVVCGSGLFTSGGHYVVLVGINGDTIGIFDPYLYTGKFNTASRRAAGVTVSGNNVYVSKASFKKYANYRNFWIFSNDSENNKNNQSENIWVPDEVNLTRYVATKESNLNVRKEAHVEASVVTKLKKGTQVNVTKVDGDWSRIDSPVNGWVSSVYLSAVKLENNKLDVAYQPSKNVYSVGEYRTTSNLNVRAGAGTNYRNKKYSELTANARNQNKSLGNRYYNGYKKGVVCTVTQVKGEWGLTKSGWICLRYCKKL